MTATNPPELTLADIWMYFADYECRRYSPLYDRICRSVSASDPVLDLVREAPPASHQPNLLLGVVHYLILGGLDHPLSAVYAGESAADPGPLFIDVCLTHRAEVLELLSTRHTHTNEVGRAAIIGPALTAAAARVGAPIGLVDVGCSAGLNLFCDAYHLDYGPAGSTGPADAAVQIECQVVRGDVPIATVLPPIAVRVGLDRAPVDVRDDDAVRWLLACVWPDTGRLERTRLALAEVRRTPPQVVAGDAVDSVAEILLGLPPEVVPVVTTTWVLGYLSPTRRVAFRNELARVSEARPIAWVSAEGPGVVDLFADAVGPENPDGITASTLGLVVFDRGTINDELLGFVQPHGRWIDWRANR